MGQQPTDIDPIPCRHHNLPLEFQPSIARNRKELIPYDRFLVRVAPADVDKLPVMLASIARNNSDIERRRMEMAAVWPLLSWDLQAGRGGRAPMAILDLLYSRLTRRSWHRILS